MRINKDKFTDEPKKKREFHWPKIHPYWYTGLTWFVYFLYIETCAWLLMHDYKIDPFWRVNIGLFVLIGFIVCMTISSSIYDYNKRKNRGY